MPTGLDQGRGVFGFFVSAGLDFDMAKAPGRCWVEVINFGVSGYGTGQELQLRRHRVWGFDPDWVVRMALTGQDFSAYVGGNRGMDFHHDVHDWMGSRPYESIAPPEVQGLMRGLGFMPVRAFAEHRRPLGAAARAVMSTERIPESTRSETSSASHDPKASPPCAA